VLSGFGEIGSASENIKDNITTDKISREVISLRIHKQVFFFIQSKIVYSIFYSARMYFKLRHVQVPPIYRIRLHNFPTLSDRPDFKRDNLFLCNKPISN